MVELFHRYIKANLIHFGFVIVIAPQTHFAVHKRVVWSLAEAREALQGLIGQAGDWTELDGYLIAYAVEPAMQPTVRASAFSAMLEMVREGVVDFRQSGHFAPIYLRRRRDGRLAAE